jgi:hypothetical protein
MVTGASATPFATDVCAGVATASDSVTFAGALSLKGISATGVTAAFGVLDNVGFAARVLSGFVTRVLVSIVLSLRVGIGVDAAPGAAILAAGRISA